MKFYSILLKQDESSAVQDAVVLHDGFSFTAFLFGAIWFLFHKMWHEAALVFLINFLILHLPSLSNVDKVVLEIALYFIIAINANRWLEDDLQKKRGYKFSGMVGAASPLDAKLRFFEKSAA